MFGVTYLLSSVIGVLSTGGIWIIDWLRAPLTCLLLWLARGSSHWEEAWLAQEKCLSNRRVLKGYLHENLIARICFLQKELVIKERVKLGCFLSEWELLRLLAVMEIANNNNRFSRQMLIGSVSFFLAAKFSLAKPAGIAVEWAHRVEDWIGQRQEDFRGRKTHLQRTCSQKTAAKVSSYSK